MGEMYLINYNSLGKLITDYRKQTGKSQEELIDELQERNAGIGRNALSFLENGKKVQLTLDTCLALCDLMECDISHLLGENECRTRDAQGVADYTGLPEEAINTLHNLTSNAGAYLLIEDLLTTPDLLNELGKAYFTHWFSFHQLRPLLEKHFSNSDKAYQDYAKKMKIRLQIAGGDLPAVPAEETVDYTRFQLQRAILHFTERQAAPSWLERIDNDGKQKAKVKNDDYIVEG